MRKIGKQHYVTADPDHLVPERSGVRTGAVTALTTY